MSFRVFNQKYLEPGTQWLMILGIAALCQPWIVVLHQWSVTIMLVGLIGFLVAVHVPPPEQESTEGHEHG
jgi:hypothetical protein